MQCMHMLKPTLINMQLNFYTKLIIKAFYAHRYNKMLDCVHARRFTKPRRLTMSVYSFILAACLFCVLNLRSCTAVAAAGRRCSLGIH